MPLKLRGARRGQGRLFALGVDVVGIAGGLRSQATLSLVGVDAGHAEREGREGQLTVQRDSSVARLTKYCEPSFSGRGEPTQPLIALRALSK